MEIVKIEYGDAVSIGKMLKSSNALTSNTVVKDVLDHITNGIALKFMDEGEILGVWCSKEFETHVSLSFFYTDEKIRRKPQLMVFFKNCMEQINLTKPLLLSTKDTTGFDKYVTKVGEDLYQFIGLRHG
jgi:hypothetical protein